MEFGFKNGKLLNENDVSIADGRLPYGTIIPIMINATLEGLISSEWKICDGTPQVIVDNPSYNKPNLSDDIFLCGSTSIPNVLYGGNNGQHHHITNTMVGSYNGAYNGAISHNHQGGNYTGKVKHRITGGTNHPTYKEVEGTQNVTSEKTDTEVRHIHDWNSISGTIGSGTFNADTDLEANMPLYYRVHYYIRLPLS